ncbi:L-serine ammonia-lyase [Paracoccus aurantiacus]|uniref:L-serine dehydratase n=1 Tax=Paracoccus aurantiacus TaxID=2599412 RepID=A0A5C6S130_9RHOB|nr:L-serine ammonia-lyase [Paracoccus aurantiacus]TXB68114.1 L-serine ammonia-lyase [Paracoccus aurantiacus]
MFLSVFDLFKIGIGPSSSHTMGPMTGAAMFLDAVAALPEPPDRISASLHGSLAFTGVGHASDRAVILGLAGERPETVDPERMEAITAKVRASGRVTPPGHAGFDFVPDRDLVLDRKVTLPGHPNGMIFCAHDATGIRLRKVYYSIGGGFVVAEEDMNEIAKLAPIANHDPVPYPFTTAAEMLRMAAESGLSIAEMKRRNETVFISPAELDARLDEVAAVMHGCIDRGLSQDGTLPGGLKVARRARMLHDKLVEDSRRSLPNPLLANDWLAVFAMAVNEENAAGGRVVTAPTNGAAGVIPAVLRYIRDIHPATAAGESGESGHRCFLLTAAAIGGIIKHNASISGAEVGCQGEIGSASAMAAAGLAAVMGGTPEQIENAAEIALEHHLGMTCDPIGGLVQVPCIERNAFGAVKAVTAASMACKSDGRHFVPLDACISTMRQTGIDMSEKYKETSLGGLAVSLPEC